MPFDFPFSSGNRRDTQSTNLSLHPYGQIGNTNNLNEIQIKYIATLEEQVKARVMTIAARVHNTPHILESISDSIENNETFQAEGTLMQLIDEMRNIKKEGTKLEYYDAIHIYIEILKMSQVGDYQKQHKEKVSGILSEI